MPRFWLLDLEPDNHIVKLKQVNNWLLLLAFLKVTSKLIKP